MNTPAERLTEWNKNKNLRDEVHCLALMLRDDSRAEQLKPLRRQAERAHQKYTSLWLRAGYKNENPLLGDYASDMAIAVDLLKNARADVLAATGYEKIEMGYLS